MDFIKHNYDHYTNLSQTLSDKDARLAAASIAAYLTTGRDIAGMYHKSLSEAQVREGSEAAKIYQDFAHRIERRFIPPLYVSDYCSFCGYLSNEQVQAFMNDSIKSIAAYMSMEEQVVAEYKASLDEKTDEELVAMCRESEIFPAKTAAANRIELLECKKWVLKHLCESKVELERLLARLI